MKRRLTKLVVFLLLGAVVNVAVAWGCVIPAHAIDHELVVFPFDQSHWAIAGIEGGRTYERLCVYSIAGESSALQSARSGPRTIISKPRWTRGLRWAQSRHAADGICFEDVRGWPLLCMWWTFRWDDRARSGFPWYVDPNDAVIVLPKYDRVYVDNIRALPLTPVWPGFAINTIFYAAILWLLALGPFTARRMIRRKRGLCIKCGYDMRGHSGGGGISGGGREVCPECGPGCDGV